MTEKFAKGKIIQSTRVSAASTLYYPALNASAFRFQTKNKPFANLPINGAVAVSKPIEGWISSVIGIVLCQFITE